MFLEFWLLIVERNNTLLHQFQPTPNHSTKLIKSNSDP